MPRPILSKQSATRDGSIPSFSLTSFQQVLDALATYDQLPDRLDKRFWDTLFEPSLASKVRGGLRFLGLIQGVDNEPTPELARLVPQSGRQAAVRDLVAKRYAGILASAQRKDATRRDVERAFASTYRISGNTVQKAVGFFAATASYADLPVSPNIQPHADPFAARRPAARSKPSNIPDVELAAPPMSRDNGTQAMDEDLSGAVEAPVLPSPITTSGGAMPLLGSTRTVNLRKGGSVTLTVAVDLFDVDDDDRAWVLDLIDRVRKHGTPSEERLADKTTGAYPAANGFTRP